MGAATSSTTSRADASVHARLRRAERDVAEARRLHDVLRLRLRSSARQEVEAEAQRTRLMAGLALAAGAAVVCAGGFVHSRAAVLRLSKRASAEMAKATRLRNIDVDSAKRSSSKAWCKAMLPTLDSLRAADATESTHEALLEGVKLTRASLEHTLVQRGVVQIPAAVGMVFDPNHHEAMGATAAVEGVADGCIVDVMETGWILDGGVVIRPARVIVAKQ